MEQCSNLKFLKRLNSAEKTPADTIQEEPLNMNNRKTSVDDIDDNNIISRDESSRDESRTSENENTPAPNDIPKIKHRKHQLKEEDAMSLLTMMSQETLMEICKYRPNMKRNIPEIKRTPKDQQRRNKNTISCRKTRRVQKLQHIAEAEKYKVLNEQHNEILREQIRALYYVDILTKLADMSLHNCENNTSSNDTEDTELESPLESEPVSELLSENSK